MKYISDDAVDKIDGKRFTSQDGYSLLPMFEDENTLVIDIGSPEVEEGTLLPKPIGIIILNTVI